MAGPSVHIDAARTDRSLVAKAPARKRTKADPVLLMWRRLIESAVADAKRTRYGLPTYSAILARWWIEEHKPKQSEAEDWERSFECACSWLKLDVDAERKLLLAQIDDCLRESLLEYARSEVYVRRAAVLSCAGVPTAIARQYVLPVVSIADYEQVAGIEHGDPPGAMLGLERAAT